MDIALTITIYAIFIIVTPPFYDNTTVFTHRLYGTHLIESKRRHWSMIRKKDLSHAGAELPRFDGQKRTAGDVCVSVCVCPKENLLETLRAPKKCSH